MIKINCFKISNMIEKILKFLSHTKRVNNTEINPCWITVLQIAKNKIFLSIAALRTLRSFIMLVGLRICVFRSLTGNI